MTHRHVLSRGEHGQPSVSSPLAQRLQRFGVVVVAKFGEVSTPELVELFRVVTVPAPQRRRWRDRRNPLIDTGRRLRQAARPQSIHENAGAVIGSRGLVHTFDGYRRSLAVGIHFSTIGPRGIGWRRSDGYPPAAEGTNCSSEPRIPAASSP